MNDTNHTYSDHIEYNSTPCEVLELMNSDMPVILISGDAISGKLDLVRHFIKTTRKTCVLLAPNDIDALILGCETFHGFFGITGTYMNPDEIQYTGDPKYKLIDTIIIDKVYLVRADWIDNIDKFMRLNGRDADEPFGGCQVILLGDLFEPPSPTAGVEREFLKKAYGNLCFLYAFALKIPDMKIVVIGKELVAGIL